MVGCPFWREMAVRTARGTSVTALSTVLAVALMGVLGSQISTMPAAAAAVTPTWQTTAAYRPLANVNAVSCAPSATASSATCVAVGDDGGNVASVIVTQDGGTTWSDSTLPAGVTTLSTVSCPSSAVCYAGGGAGIMKSSDGGASWTIQDSSFPPQSISCFTIDECTAVRRDRDCSTPRTVPTGTLKTSPSGLNSLSGVSCPRSTHLRRCGFVEWIAVDHRYHKMGTRGRRLDCHL